MSEDKRKNARLQGRFSDEHKPPRKEKKKFKNDANRQDESSSSPKEKNSSLKPSQAVEGLDLKFDESAKVPIKQLQEEKKPVELQTAGIHILSHTENGISRVIFEPDFIPETEADELFTILNHATQWYDKNIIIHGKEIPQPRLVAWYGPYPYTYSGAVLDPLEMSPKLLSIKDRIEKCLHNKWNISASFNSVLLNLYRNEKDSVAWHSDDELSLGLNPTIASVSLGEVRKFEMSVKPWVRDSDPDLVSTDYVINLTPGSLIIMDGSMQKDWKHQVPKEYHNKRPRINLTFRTVHSKDEIPSQVPSKTAVNSKNLSYSKTEDTKHVFDNNNFPPLSANNSEKDKKSLNSVSQTKIKSTVEIPCENNTIHNEMHSNENNADSQITELNSSACEEIVPSQDTDFTSTPCSMLTNNKDMLYMSTKEIDQSEDHDYNDNVNFEDTSNKGQSEVSPLMLEEETNHKGSQLNADAIEFVPKCLSISKDSYPLYHKLDIVELADLFESEKVAYLQFEEFSLALKDKISQNYNMFTYRDHHELGVLVSINDSSQIEIHRRRILSRLCSMIKNAAKSNMVPRNTTSYYGPRSSNRTGYRDNYRPRNNSYKSNSFKGKGFKD